MEDLSKFKNKIFIYGVLVMLIMEVISLPFLGFNLKFLYGLLLGTAISIVNFNIMTFATVRMLKTGKSYLAAVNYIIRLLIYGGVFYVAIKTDNLSGLGCILGFITTKVAIYIVHGFKPGFKWMKSKRGEGISEGKQDIFIGDPYLVVYCRGRAVMTYKKYPDYKKR